MTRAASNTFHAVYGRERRITQKEGRKEEKGKKKKHKVGSNSGYMHMRIGAMRNETPMRTRVSFHACDADVWARRRLDRLAINVGALVVVYHVLFRINSKPEEARRVHGSDEAQAGHVGVPEGGGEETLHPGHWDGVRCHPALAPFGGAHELVTAVGRVSLHVRPACHAQAVRTALVLHHHRLRLARHDLVLECKAQFRLALVAVVRLVRGNIPRRDRV